MNIKVSPSVLRRLRTNRRLELDYVAEKTKLDLDKLQAYEEAEHEIPLKELEALAKQYHLSWYAFLDSELEPPRTFGNDNRSQRNQRDTISSDMQKIMEDVGYMLDVADEIAPDTRLRFPITVSEHPVPEVLARQLRAALSITTEEVQKQGDEYGVWNYWKDKLSTTELYIIERSWPVETIRAFSIRRGKKAAAVVSTKDVPLARVFSLMHEVYHLLLRQNAICDMHYSSNYTDIEVKCNRFAAAMIMPATEFEEAARELGLSTGRIDTVTDSQAKDLQRHFKSSRLSTYRRLLTLGFISPKFYEKVHGEYGSYEKSSRPQNGGSSEMYYRRRINEVGRQYAGEALSAFKDGKITALNLANMLSVRVSQLPELRSLIGGSNGRSDK